MTNKVRELFGHSPSLSSVDDWPQLIKKSECPFLHRKCVKVRKSQPNIAIGTCVVSYGADARDTVICPHRLLERGQIFTDCIHLLTLHEPGNELHILGEQSVPGGSVDYFLVSARQRRVRDFVGIELQTLDTTGTIWPERQRLLNELGLRVRRQDTGSSKSFGMNWKMSAKTILVQLHHKIETFEHIGKHLVLVAQDLLIEYMLREFSFGHLSSPPRLGDSMQLHAYGLTQTEDGMQLELGDRFSTDAAGIARCLGLQADAKIELETITATLESQLSDATLLSL